MPPADSFSGFVLMLGLSGSTPDLAQHTVLFGRRSYDAEFDAVFGRPAIHWLIIERILLLPFIAGIAYELIRFAGKHQNNRVLMTLLAPGLWLQRLTTREPSLDQLEVSIRALNEVLDLEEEIVYCRR